MASALPTAVRSNGPGEPARATWRINTPRAQLPWWFAVAMVIAVAVAYAPVFRAGFIWDDDAHLTRAALQSWPGLGRIWFESGATQQYYPILHTAFWIEHRLWGNAALGYHIVNLVFHVCAALLFTQLLRRLAIPGALLAGALWALHPVQVESVAWISEQKNTLSAIFALLAALSFLRFDATRQRRTYVLALVAFLLAVLTKSVVATLPAVLLVIFWYRDGRITWPRARPLLPWFAFAVIAGIWTAWIERKIIGAEGAAFELSSLDRAVLAGRATWFYLGKLLWPQSLAFFYPRWAVDAMTLVQWPPTFALMLAILWAWRVRSHSRAPLATSLLYVGTLFPALGFVNVYPFMYSFVADHFQYHASFATVAGATAALTVALRTQRRVAATAGILAVGSLAVLTRQQSADYTDGPALWRATLARNPHSWIAHNNLGKELLADRARLDAAVRHFERAIELRPAYPEAHNNLGLALTQAGRPLEALPHLQRSVELQPRSYQTYNNLGIALAAAGQGADAVVAFNRAVTLNPKLPNLHENLAKALTLVGRRDEAAAETALAQQLRSAAATPSPPTSRPTRP